MPPSDAVRSRPLVLTAANWRYARTLWQFLRSAERRRHVAGYDWIAYDLGMTAEQSRELARRFPWCEFRRFEYERFPPHVAVTAGNFAWKPQIIREVALERSGPVLWMDSAAIITRGLAGAFDVIRRDGFLMLTGQTPIAGSGDERTLSGMDLPTEVRAQSEIVATVFGFDPAHPLADELTRRWAECSLDEALIAPPNPTFHHNYDQTLLGCLLLEAMHDGRLAARPAGDIDISSGRPVRWFSTRNKVDPRLPTWADPLSRLWYWTYKTVDQALHRRKVRAELRAATR